MASTASTRALTKAIGAFFVSPALPLPADLTQVIEAYLEKHEKQDAEDRLQDELQSIHQKHVLGQSPARIAHFLAILRHLRPVIRSPAKVLHWVDLLLEPFLNNICRERDITAESLANIEALFTPSLVLVPALFTPSLDSQDEPDPLTARAVELWLQYAGQDVNTAAIFKERILRETILKLGKKQPKAFMTALASLIAKKEHRCQVMALLCEFVQSQPPHLHLAVQTSLFARILTCLDRDTSTTVVSLALAALTMLMPNLPSSLAPHLPKLFNIYAKLLFWDRERSLESGVARSRLEPDGSDPWEVLAQAPESEEIAIPQLLNYFTILYGLYPINFMDYIRKPQRYLRHANFPNADDIEIQPSEIRHRSERFRQMHLLHANFYSMTIESEKTDFGRWMRSEPSAVITECMALCTYTQGGEDHDAMLFAGGDAGRGPPSADDPDTLRSLLGSSVMLSPSHELGRGNWRHTQSTAVDSPNESRAHSTIMRRSSQSSHPSTRDSIETRPREKGADSPTLPPVVAPSPSHIQLQEMILSNKVMKSGLSQSLANDSVPSLSLSHQDSVAEPSTALAPVLFPQADARSTGTPSNDSSGEIVRLKRQVMVLRNDLNFERYMKRQHVTHIGELRRRQVKEAATEAETQSLIMGHRNLKIQLEAAKRAELQVRRDLERSRTLGKKWEADLSAKLKTSRDDLKKRNVEVDSLRRDLDSAKDEYKRLQTLLCDAEVKEINAQQIMQSIDISRTETERLRSEVDRLSAVERDYQAGQMAAEERLAATAEVEQRAEILAMKLKSTESELQALSSRYQSQIVVLNTKLSEAQHNSKRRGDSGGGEDSGGIESLLESAMAASRAKQAELQKQYSVLMRKYMVLQSAALDTKKTAGDIGGGGNGSSARRRNEASSSAEADAEISAIVAGSSSLSSFSARTRTQRGLSDPVASEAALPGVHLHQSISLQEQQSFGSATSATSTGTAVHRPSTPSGGTSRSQDALAGKNTSPQAERYYGRGGVQNTIRKERKEKKKDDSEKRDKSSGGIRGIRGFV